MIPDKLTNLMLSAGKLQKHAKGEVFHSQNFDEMLFQLKTGFVKRYQVAADGKRTIELIYGPGHIFPLSQLYKTVFGVEQNQENLVYVYQAMTDIEIYSLTASQVHKELDSDNALYIDLFYEAGLRLKSNIQRLASNALNDDYKKLPHQLVCLAEEFGDTTNNEAKQVIKILVPLTALDMAEQLHISQDVAEAVLNNLCKRELIETKDDYVKILDLDALKDTYL